MISPVIPGKAGEMRAQLGLPPLSTSAGRDLWPRDGGTERYRGEALGVAAPLFPTYDKDGEQAQLEKLMPKPPVPDTTTTTTASSTTTPSTTTTPTAITYDQLTAVDLRVGLVLSCERIPRKDKLLLLRVDLGERDPRIIVAGIAQTFAPEALVGRRVIVVANLAPRDFGKGLVSHGMILATGPGEALQLATIGDGAAPGSRLR